MTTSPGARTRLGSTLLAVAASTLSCAPTTGGAVGTGQGLCAAVIVYQGHGYYGNGELKRDPATTGRHVTGTLPACDETGGQGPAGPGHAVRVTELEDVPLGTAFLWQDSIFIRKGRDLPAASRIWFRAPHCTTAGTFRIRADWYGVTGPEKPRFDGDVRPPYRLDVHVTNGPSRYVGTTIEVHADATTEPALRPEDVTRSLWKGGQVMADVTCESGRFTALSLRVPRT